MSAKCRTCGQDLMVPDGQRRVHFAKPTDERPCDGSWPERIQPKQTTKVST